MSLKFIDRHFSLLKTMVSIVMKCISNMTQGQNECPCAIRSQMCSSLQKGHSGLLREAEQCLLHFFLTEESWLMLGFQFSFNYAIKISKVISIFVIILNLTVLFWMLKNVFSVKGVYSPAFLFQLPFSETARKYDDSISRQAFV